MAKSTHAAGDSYTPEEINDPVPPVRIRRAVLGEVDKPSDGTDSSMSSEKETKTKDNERQRPQQPARVESPSDPPVEEQGSIAPSTDGDTPRMSPQRSVRKATPAKKATGKARARSTDDDFEDDF